MFHAITSLFHVPRGFLMPGKISVSAGPFRNGTREKGKGLVTKTIMMKVGLEVHIYEKGQKRPKNWNLFPHFSQSRSLKGLGQQMEWNFSCHDLVINHKVLTRARLFRPLENWAVKMIPLMMMLTSYLT